MVDTMAKKRPARTETKTTHTVESDLSIRRACKIRIPSGNKSTIVVKSSLEGLVPSGVQILSVRDDPRYPQYFAIAHLEDRRSGKARDDSLPVCQQEATIDQLPWCKARLGRENFPPEKRTAEFDFSPMDARQAEAYHSAQEDEVFGAVPAHRRCTVCWGNYRGKARKRQSSWRRINSSKVKVYYVCDSCSNKWAVVTETLKIHYGSDGEIITDQDRAS